MHEGHRQRLYDKFSRDTKALSDHEILELMLFPLLPRVNTNAIAHDLLSAFGDLNGVLGATEKQLCTVRGIGSSAARSLAVIGEAFRRQGGVVRKKPKIMRLHDVKEIVRELFEDCDTEKVEMLLLNASRRLMLVKTVTDYKIDSVGIPPMEIAETLVSVKPRSVIFAHNHPSGSAQPSLEDDRATGMLSALLSMHNVSLFDHIIYAKGEIFSYFMQTNMKEIYEEFKFENLIKNKDIRKL